MYYIYICVCVYESALIGPTYPVPVPFPFIPERSSISRVTGELNRASFVRSFIAVFPCRKTRSEFVSIYRFVFVFKFVWFIGQVFLKVIEFRFFLNENFGF